MSWLLISTFIYYGEWIGSYLHQGNIFARASARYPDISSPMSVADFLEPYNEQKRLAALQFCCRNIWQLQDVCSPFSASLMIHVQDNQLHLCNQQIDTAIMTPWDKHGHFSHIANKLMISLRSRYRRSGLKPCMTLFNFPETLSSKFQCKYFLILCFTYCTYS